MIDPETFDPEELGWVRIGERVWECPDGHHYIFPPGVPELIQRWRMPEHWIWPSGPKI